MSDPVDAFDTKLTPSDVDPLRPEPVETPWGSFAIYSCAGRMVAAQSFCPHMQGPLFQGTIAGETVTCPWHEWRFSLATGRRLDLEGRELLGGAKLDFLDARVGPAGTILLSPP